MTISTHSHRILAGICAILLTIASPGLSAMAADVSPADITSTETAPEPAYDPNQPQILTERFLEAETAVLIEQHSGKILYDLNSGQRMQPASITKVMTLLLALEHGDLTDIIVVGDEINQIPGDSSKVPILEGEQLTLEQLLYGLMIKSGNDAAMTIGTHISGSVEAFVELMNKRARELGCTGTNFTNPHGYEDPNHYSTAMDMAIIARAGMQHEIYRTIVGTPSYTIPKNNLRESDTIIRSKNQFIGRSDDMEHQYQYGTGIKTGYFSDAKHTFVASATKDGVDLIAVVMRSSQKGKWIDATRLMEYGFAVCRPYSLEELYKTAPMELEIDGAAIEESVRLDFAPGQQLTLADTKESIDKMTASFADYYTFEKNAVPAAPLKQGDEVGTLIFRPDGGGESRFLMVASQDIPGVSAPADEETRPDDQPASKPADKTQFKVSPVVVLILVFAVIIIAALVTVHHVMTAKRRRRREQFRASLHEKYSRSEEDSETRM